MSREALEKVLASRHFAAAQKQSAFLRWVVEKTLDGQADEIKEYSIAVEVYGRKPDYDPQANSAVRVDASRLRARLSAYYQDEGRDDPVRIELPKGSYVPLFTAVTECAPAVSPEAPPQEAPFAVEPPPAVPSSRLSRYLALLAIPLFAVAGLAWWWFARTQSIPVSAIAVLPFVSLNATPEDDAFCDGVTEEVTAALAREGGIKVPARTVMAQHKGKPVDLKKLASELRVQAFLEGSLRREGSRYLFTAQLIDARDGFHIWAETYDRSDTSRLDMQREVARSMSRAIVERILGREQWRITGRPASSGEAMTAYLRANDLLRTDPRVSGWSRGVPKEHAEAIRLLTRVTQLEPRFAPGWAALAQSFLIASEYDKPAQSGMIEEAKTAARRAAELDESLGQAWGTLGDIALYIEWKLDEAERFLRRSIELQPRDPQSQQQYADLLRITGRLREADVELNRAIALAPADASLRAQRALHLYDQHRFEECRDEAAQSLKLRPGYTLAIWLRGLCFQSEGKWAEAENEFRAALQIAKADGRALPALANLYASMGRKHESDILVNQMRELGAQGRPIYYALALVHAGGGNKAAAISELERAYQERDPSMLYMTVEQRFDPIAKEPGFRDITRRLGLIR